MPGQKISTLAPVSDLQAADQLPLARSGSTYKITGDKFASKAQLDGLSATADNKFALKTSLDSLSSNTITVADSPTIDLTYNSSTRTLSADIITSSLNFLPTGSVIVFPCIAAPTGWLALDGQLLSRAAQPALWAFANSSGNIVTDAQWTSLGAYGSFSQGDGSLTFRLPDVRGYFLRCSGTHTDGTAAGAFGIKQADGIISHTHSGTTGGRSAQHSHTIPGFKTGNVEGNANIQAKNAYLVGTNNIGTHGETQEHTHNFTSSSMTPAGATETRPKNISFLCCIKS